jgi:hypothetical protein
MGMAVEARRLAVSSPSRVRNSRVGVKDLGQVWLGLVDERLKLGDLADLFESKHLILLVTVNCQTSRVVASVL